MATFGNTATDTAVDDSFDTRLATLFVAPESGTITAMSARVRFASATDTLYIGFYSDNAGIPGTLLASVSQSVSSSGSIALVTITGGTYAFTGGTSYWIVIAPGAGGTSAFKAGYTATGTIKYDTHNNLPASGTWSTTGTFTGSICAYVTYTPSGGGATPLRRQALLNGLGSSGKFFHNPLG